MKFKMQEEGGDIVSVAGKLHEAELAGTKLDPELRDLLGKASGVLQECHLILTIAVEQLLYASKLHAGYSASDSKQLEISQLKNKVLVEQAAALDFLLKRVAEPQPIDGKEVI